MKTGSLPNSITRGLEPELTSPNFAPDGLDETAIDALIEETCGFDLPQVEPDPVDLGEEADIHALPLRAGDVATTESEAA